MRTSRPVVLVTGAASGIGFAVAQQYAADGAQLLLADVDASVHARAAELGGDATVFDVSDADAFDATCREVVATHGRIDVMVLNAGVSCGVSDPAELEPATYRHVLGVNLDGVVYGTMAAARHMEHGVVVAVASLAGLVPFPADPAYTASKHAVVAWMRSVAPGLAARGISTHVVCPGFTDTPLLGAAEREAIAAYAVPLLSADDVADAIRKAAADPEPGSVWVCQPSRPPERFRFGGVPGPGPSAADAPHTG